MYKYTNKLKIFFMNLQEQHKSKDDQNGLKHGMAVRLVYSILLIISIGIWSYFGYLFGHNNDKFVSTWHSSYNHTAQSAVKENYFPHASFHMQL